MKVVVDICFKEYILPLRIEEEGKMSTIQILFRLYFAFIGAYLSVILAMVLRQNGRILDEMDEGFRRMDEGLNLFPG